MASISSIIAQGPRPTNFGILTPNEQESQTNALAFQRQQNALEEQRVREAKDAAEARARVLRDQAIITADQMRQSEIRRQNATPEGPAVPVAAPPAPANNLAAPPDGVTPTPGMDSAAGGNPVQGSPIPATNVLAGAMAQQGGAPLPINELAARAAQANGAPSDVPAGPVGVQGSPIVQNELAKPAASQQAMAQPAPVAAPAKKLTRDEEDEAEHDRLIRAGISAPGLANWKAHKTDMREKVAKLSKEEAANEAVRTMAAVELLDAAAVAPPQMWSQARAMIVQKEPSLDSILPQEKPAPEQFAFLVQGLGHLKRELDLRNAGLLGAQRKAQADLAVTRGGLVKEQTALAVRANLAGPLAAAAMSGNPDTYAAAYHKLPQELQASGELTTPQEYDPEKAEEIAKGIQTWGSSVTQQQKTAHQEEQEARLSQKNADVRDRNAAMATEATRRNDIRQQDANTRAGKVTTGLTGNARGVQGRYDATAAKKQDKDESAFHLKLLELGQTIGSSTVTDRNTGTVTVVANTEPYKAQYKFYQGQLQQLLLDKAVKRFGFEAPDMKTAAGVPEGGEFTTPNGKDVWRKTDGILYWDHAAKPAAAAQPVAPAPQAAPVQPAKPVAAAPVVAPQAGPPPPAAGTVRMKSPGPNGQIANIPQDQVEHYKKKGATVVP